MKTPNTIVAALLVIAVTVPLQAQSQQNIGPRESGLTSRQPSYPRDPNSVEVWSGSRTIIESAAGSVHEGSAIQKDTLTDKAHRSLADKGIQTPEKYVITSSGGKVAVFGRTDDQRQKEKVGEILKQIEGVDEVENHILISKNEEPKSDAELIKSIQRQLYWSWFVDEKKVTVEAKDGVVTLSGSVEDWSELNSIIENAFDGGAVQVVNKLDGDQAVQSTPLEWAAQEPRQGERPSEQRWSQNRQDANYPDRYPQSERSWQDPYRAQRSQSGQYDRNSGYQFASERGQRDLGYDDPQRPLSHTQYRDPSGSAMQWQRVQEIEQAVQKGLQQRLQGSEIFADYKDGTLRIYGYARDAGQKQQAERLIRQLRGVRAGQSFLEVRGGGDSEPLWRQGQRGEYR